MTRGDGKAVTAAHDLGLQSCACCRLVLPSRSGRARCPRCGAALSPRKPDSLSRTWAFLLAGMILYLPANLLPVMETRSLFGHQSDTILSGVVYFWTTGSQGLAALIFSVSILVPLLKMGTLLVLLVSVHRRSPDSRQERGHLFRVVEAVGRWSMLDVFVVALMVGLVHFGSVAVIEAGPGAASFGAVVVLTMLAAHSFDPRLIWDDMKGNDERTQ